MQRLGAVRSENIVWSNLNQSRATRMIRFILSWVISIALIVFFVPIASFAGSISNVSQLCVKVSWLAFVCRYSGPALGVIQGILPPVSWLDCEG